MIPWASCTWTPAGRLHAPRSSVEARRGEPAVTTHLAPARLARSSPRMRRLGTIVRALTPPRGPLRVPGGSARSTRGPRRRDPLARAAAAPRREPGVPWSATPRSPSPTRRRTRSRATRSRNREEAGRSLRRRRLEPEARRGPRPRRAARSTGGEGRPALGSPAEAGPPGRGDAALRPPAGRDRRAGEERLRGAGAARAGHLRRLVPRDLPVGDAALRLGRRRPPRRLPGQRRDPGAPGGAAPRAPPRTDARAHGLRAPRGRLALPGGDGARSRPLPHRGPLPPRRSPGRPRLRRDGRPRRSPRGKGEGGGGDDGRALRAGAGGSTSPPSRRAATTPPRSTRPSGPTSAPPRGSRASSSTSSRRSSRSLAADPGRRPSGDAARGRGRARARRSRGALRGRPTARGALDRAWTAFAGQARGRVARRPRASGPSSSRARRGAT